MGARAWIKAVLLCLCILADTDSANSEGGTTLHGDSITRIVFSSADFLSDVHIIRNGELVEERFCRRTTETNREGEEVIEISADVLFDEMAVMVHSQQPTEQQSDGDGDGAAPMMDIYVYADHHEEGRKVLWWTSFAISNETQVKRFVFAEDDLRASHSRVQQGSRAASRAPPSSAPKYSSFHCLYGSQIFPNWTDIPLAARHIYPYSEAELRKRRVCVYSNVCFVNNKFYYYENEKEIIPDDMRYSSISPLEHMQSQTYFATELGPRFNIINNSIPETMLWSSPPDKIFFFQQQSQTYNFAHCLLEDLMPVQMAMDVFNLGGIDKASVIHDCVSTYQSEEVMAACRRNIKTYSSLLDIDVVLAHTIIGQTFCFPKLVLGHSMAFSQWHINHLDTPHFRTVRDKMLVKFGFETLSPPTSQRVLVLLKSSFGFTPNGRAISWGSICEDVTTLLEGLGVAVECFVPTIHNNKALTYAMHKATVIISEDGTISLNSLFFGREGCVHVIKGRTTNPTMWSVHLKYLYFEEMEELPSVLQFALNTAARDLALS